MSQNASKKTSEYSGLLKENEIAIGLAVFMDPAFWKHPLVSSCSPYWNSKNRPHVCISRCGSVSYWLPLFSNHRPGRVAILPSDVQRGGLIRNHPNHYNPKIVICLRLKDVIESSKTISNATTGSQRKKRMMIRPESLPNILSLQIPSFCSPEEIK